MMNRFIVLVAACVVLAGFYFILRPSGHNQPDLPSESLSDVTQVSATSKPSDTELKRATSTAAATDETKAASMVTIVEKPATPYLLGSPNTPPTMDPEIVVRNMRNAIHQYKSQFGGNPIGTNPEIAEALNGGNPKEARFINEESGLRINGRGELVDSWGIPFFFHQLSAAEMEIRSAGPDHKMWTRDDLVTK
jgi:hypothetical protein